MSKSKSVKIADVGLAKNQKEITGTLAGTPLYMAPEILASKKYDSAADIYSFGITMWEMWYGKDLFSECHGLDTGDLVKKVREGLRPTHNITCRLPLERWKKVMECCWAEDSRERPNAAWCEKVLKPLLNDQMIISYH